MTIHMRANDMVADRLPAAQGITKATYSWIRLAWRRALTCVNYCADRYAAAVMYENLAALSDPELDRRGLSRANLAHDVSTLDHGGPQ